MSQPVLVEAHNPGPMTGRGNNTYLLIGSTAALLIDAGVGHREHVAAIERHLSTAAVPLESVLVTHAHGDHASGAPMLHEAFPTARFRKYPWPEEDRKHAVEWEPLADRQVLTLGGEEIVVLHTPGHSPDHLSFWQRDSGVIFTGDLVIAGSSVMIHTSRGGRLGEYLDSLRLLISLKPSRLLPAHGPAIDDPGPVLQRYLDHRAARERQVVAALAAGFDTVETIAESIYDGLDPALMPAACENVRAHLDQLEREGRAVFRSGTWTRSSTSSTSTANDTSTS